jgi:hypothetical protein
MAWGRGGCDEELVRARAHIIAPRGSWPTCRSSGKLSAAIHAGRRGGQHKLLAAGGADELERVLAPLLRLERHDVAHLHARRHLAVEQRLRDARGARRRHLEVRRLGRENLDPARDAVVVAEVQRRGVAAGGLVVVEGQLESRGNSGWSTSTVEWACAKLRRRSRNSMILGERPPSSGPAPSCGAGRGTR